MRVSKLASGVCMAAMLATATFAVAQQRTQPDQRPDRQRPGQERNIGRESGSDLSGTDTVLAVCLAIENHKEIQIAELAQQQAQSENVKQFAQQMIQEHRQLATKLDQLTGGKAQAVVEKINVVGGTAATDRRDARTDARVDDRTPPRTDNRTPPRGDDDRTPPRQDDRASARQPVRDRSPGQDQSLDLITLKTELAEECLKSFRSELGQKSGREFDTCFMYAQVMAHMGMIDALTVFERHASPELQRAITEAKSTSKQHLEKAKQIVAQLDGDESSNRRQ